jgi:hypothetical protein
MQHMHNAFKFQDSFVKNNFSNAAAARLHASLLDAKAVIFKYIFWYNAVQWQYPKSISYHLSMLTLNNKNLDFRPRSFYIHLNAIISGRYCEKVVLHLLCIVS